MKSSAIVSLLVFSAIGCEVFTIGSGSQKTEREIERSQKTAAGVVHMWKAEIDNMNYIAASELMLHPSGRKLLAVERKELSEELAIWHKRIGGKAITRTSEDTLSTTSCTVTITVDYITTISFRTTQLQATWYLADIRKLP